LKTTEIISTGVDLFFLDLLTGAGASAIQARIFFEVLAVFFSKESVRRKRMFDLKIIFFRLAGFVLK